MKKGITIGMDLGDKKHQVCILDKTGKIIAEEAVAGTRAAMTSFFKRYRGAVGELEELGSHMKREVKTESSLSIEANNF